VTPGALDGDRAQGFRDLERVRDRALAVVETAHQLIGCYALGDLAAPSITSGHEQLGRELNTLVAAAGKRAESGRRPAKADRVRVDRGEFDRASGETVCVVCACSLYEHAAVQGYEWLVRGCDGRLLKL
jgi:hypothetical protein